MDALNLVVWRDLSTHPFSSLFYHGGEHGLLFTEYLDLAVLFEGAELYLIVAVSAPLFSFFVP